MSLRRDVLEAARVEARRIIGDAIDYRRKHPYLFYVFHKRMADYHRMRGHRVRWAWHRWLRERYFAKSRATAEAAKCRRL